jgi:hypothetical protein
MREALDVGLDAVLLAENSHAEVIIVKMGITHQAQKRKD